MSKAELRIYLLHPDLIANSRFFNNFSGTGRGTPAARKKGPGPCGLRAVFEIHVYSELLRRPRVQAVKAGIAPLDSVKKFSV